MLPLPGIACAQGLRGSRKDVRAKAGRRLGRGYVAQQLVGAAEFRVQAPGLRILQQQARKLGPLRDGQFAVEVRLNQFLELALVHGHRSPARGQLLLQELPRRVQARLDGLRVDSEDLGHVLVVAVHEVPEHDHGAVLRLEPLDRFEHDVAPLILGQQVGRTGVIRGEPLIDGPGIAVANPQDVERFVDRHPVDPAVELVLRVIVGEVLVGLHEDCLCDVARILGVAQHAQGHVVNRLFVLPDERGEGLRIARQAIPDPRCIDVLTHNNYTRGTGKLAGRAGPGAPAPMLLRVPEIP